MLQAVAAHAGSPVSPPNSSAAEAPPALVGEAATAGAPACTKSDFETVVDQAAASLRDLNQKNKPELQEKLRQLKDKRGWSEDQFLKEAAPFVKDDAIDGFDGKTNDLLSQISAMGDEGSAAATPDCNLFQTLRGLMSTLVDTQTSKWTYMFTKIDAELAK